MRWKSHRRCRRGFLRIWLCGLIGIAVFRVTLAAADPVPSGQLLKTAAEHLQRGRYAEAAEVFTRVPADAPEAEAAAVGLSRAIEAEYGPAKALEMLSGRQAAQPDSVLIRARQAELQFASGDLASAARTAGQLLEVAPDNVRSRWIQAKVAVEQGRIDTADEEFRWFVRYYNRVQPGDADTLLLVAAGAGEYARWHSVSSIFNFIINTLCPDALNADPLSWQAYHASGALLLEKYNRTQALPDLHKALTINPRAVPVLASLAEAAIQQHDPDEAERLARQALKVQAESVPALQLLADAQFLRGDISGARDTLERARRGNPIDQGTLGRLAACLHLLETRSTTPADEARLKDLLTTLDSADRAPLENPSPLELLILEIAARNPRPGEFLATFASRLEMRRRYDLAETLYLQAIRLMPQLAQPRTALGMLYMQTGRTKDAEQLLDSAFQADPYHVRVANMRKVLGVLNSYRTLTTDHFVIRFDARSDAILGEYLAEYLEETYQDLVRQYGFEPPHRTTFEIYHDARGLAAHQWFSARMIGLPWVQTIGASTGMMVALASPTASKTPYNWARVVRHEFVHIVTLQQTRFNIPHWFTEALAVTSENTPRPAVWNQLLLERVPRGELSSLDELNSVFVRPETPLDWQFAYCQSRLYAQYMIEKFGQPKIAAMLDAYRRSLSTNEAIPEVFQVSVEEFEAGYHEFLKHIVEHELRGSAVAAPKSLAELEKDYEAHADDPAVVAALAKGMLDARRRQKARELAEEARRINAREPLAAVVLAELDLLGRDFAGAAELLYGALDESSPHPEVVMLLARIRLMQRQPEEAARLYEVLGSSSSSAGTLPGSDARLKGLAACYVQTGETDRLRQVLETLASLDGDDASVRKKLAQLAVDRGDVAAAEKWAVEALHIDVMDSGLHQVLASVYAERGDADRATRERRFVELLEGR